MAGEVMRAERQNQNRQHNKSVPIYLGVSRNAHHHKSRTTHHARPSSILDRVMRRNQISRYAAFTHFKVCNSSNCVTARVADVLQGTDLQGIAQLPHKTVRGMEKQLTMATSTNARYVLLVLLAVYGESCIERDMISDVFLFQRSATVRVRTQTPPQCRLTA